MRTEQPELKQLCCVCEGEVSREERQNGGYCRKCSLNLHTWCSSPGDDGPWCPDCWLKLTRQQPQQSAATPAPLPEYRILQGNGSLATEDRLNELARQGYELVHVIPPSDTGEFCADYILRLSPQARAEQQPMVQQVWRASVNQRYRIDALEAVQVARGEVLTALEERVEQVERTLSNLAANVPVVQ